MTVSKPLTLLVVFAAIALTLGYRVLWVPSTQSGVPNVSPESGNSSTETSVISRLDLAMGGVVTVGFSGEEREQVLLESPFPERGQLAQAENTEQCIRTIDLATSYENSCITLTFDEPGTRQPAYGFERDYARFIAGPPATHDLVRDLKLNCDSSITITTVQRDRPYRRKSRTIMRLRDQQGNPTRIARNTVAYASLSIPQTFFETCLTITFATPGDEITNNRLRATDLTYVAEDLNEYREFLGDGETKQNAPQRERARSLAISIDQHGVESLQRRYDFELINVDVRAEAKEDLLRTFFARNGLVLKHLEKAQLGNKSAESGFRRARILVPPSVVPEWLRRLPEFWFVGDVAADVSEYRAVCERHGGLIRYSGGTGEYCVDLPLPAIDWRAVDFDAQEQCMIDGGQWRTYPSTCNDYCSFDRHDACGAAITQACDCGPDRCLVGTYTWNQTPKVTCVRTPDWHLKSGRVN
jgi:hypothetical protein